MAGSVQVSALSSSPALSSSSNAQIAALVPGTKIDVRPRSSAIGDLLQALVSVLSV